MPLIDLMKLPVAHQYFAIDHHGLHIASLGAVNELAEDLVHRLIVNCVDIDKDQIRSLADFHGSTDRPEAKSFGAAGGCHTQHGKGIDDAGVLMMHLLQQRSRLHRFKKIL